MIDARTKFGSRRRGSVARRRELAAQRGHVLDARRRRQQVSHVAFAFAERAVNQQRVEAARGEPFCQRDGLNRRSSDVQARDDARDPHVAHSTTRVPEAAA